MGCHSTAAILTLSTRSDARNQDMITHLESSDTTAYLFYDAYALMAQNSTFFNSRHVPFKNVQIRPANSRLSDAHQGVRFFLEKRPRHLFQSFLSWPVIDKCFHRSDDV